MIVLLLPFAFGVFGVLNYNVNKGGSYNSLLVGAIFGLLLSIVGRFYLDLPKKLFLLPNNKQYTVHLYAPVIYALIFYIIISPMQDIFIPLN